MEKEEEPRYVHLLQPNRDLAANWAVDVARELESYLAGLSLLPIADEEAHDSFNFAEAALLIQGSIQIYSRKVEYLYALVLQALDFIANKKQSQEEHSSIRENGKDADIIEDKEEDFLNLDDVPEERNIDIVDEQNGSSCITPAVRPPACLLVVEGDNVDISGDAGELAMYQISTSRLHRDFLLLDPCDAKVVDEYWRDNARSQVKGMPAHPSSSIGHGNIRSNVLTPLPNGHVDVGASEPVHTAYSTQGGPTMVDGDGLGHGMDDWHDDDGGGDTWGDEMNGRAENNNKDAAVHDIADDRNPQNSSRENECVVEDDVPDPWAPLNPHEPGTLPVVPYKRGRPNRRRKVKKNAESRLEPAVSELGKVWQALESLEREAWRAKASEELPPYEKLRSSFFAKRVSGVGINWSDKGSDSESSQSGNDGFEGVDGPDAYEPDVVEDFVSQEPSQQTGLGTEHAHGTDVEKGVGDELHLEGLCQAQLDAVLKKHAQQSEKLTELANRVVSWNKKIEKHLAVQDGHPPFDIHAYGERILDRLSLPRDDDTDASTSAVEKPFTQIVAGFEKHEVARTFVALLQLVNNGNVALDKACQTSGSIQCFTAEKPFAVKLLSCRKRHEEMLHYRAPSSRRQVSSGRKKGKGKLVQTPVREDEGENIGVAAGSSQAIFPVTPPSIRPQSMGKSRRLSGGIGRGDLDKELMGSLKKVSNSPKSNTPEGKRRRRRPSLKAVQVRMAG